MHVVLWDTRKLDVSKDFAGGFGIGQYPGRETPRDWVLRWFTKRDRRPTSLLFAYLAAIFGRLGHRVEYVEDRAPPAADLYVFAPALMTAQLEKRMIERVAQEHPQARIFIVGTTASVLPELFADLPATIVKGEAEQLLWSFDEVMASPQAAVQLGVLEDLDRLPPPDWSPFRPNTFRVGFDFTAFPTAFIQASRGCRFKCNYCPYLVLDNSTRFRDPNAVVDEIRQGIARWGFRSFKFRDPLFGLSRSRTAQLIDLLGRLGNKIEFSVESRIELLPPETLRMLKRVGLTSVTIGIETPHESTLANHNRETIDADRQKAFVATCRGLGIRTVAGFMIGFPHDTEASIRAVRNYAVSLGPTFANFNVVTPYPGTEFYQEIRDRLGEIDLSQLNVYTPVLQYEHLSRGEIGTLLRKCFRHYYFRWQYLHENGTLLWPGLDRFFSHPEKRLDNAEAAHDRVPKPLLPSDRLRTRGMRVDGPHGSQTK